MPKNPQNGSKGPFEGDSLNKDLYIIVRVSARLKAVAKDQPQKGLLPDRIQKGDKTCLLIYRKDRDYILKERIQRDGCT